MISRRALLAAGGVAVLASVIAAPNVLAHHGWRWAEDGNFELIGIITAVQLGNPHGVLTVDAEGELWTVEVGQPWRNEQAGLTDDLLSIGREVTISGARSADPAEKKVKAERVIIDDQLYDLYPNRD